MHTFGSVLYDVRGINMVVAVLENAIFNCGVTCFVLISGYFSVELRWRRLLKLELTVLFYSLLGMAVRIFLQEDMSLIYCINSFFPVITRKYWFISCYFVLMVLSPYINQIPKKMQKAEYEKFLTVCILIFSIIPTIFFLGNNIMSDDGKGLANMVVVYLVGRYIRLYHDYNEKRSKLFCVAFGCIMCTFSLNMFLSIFRGTCTSNFARDCSFTIFISAIYIFLLFKNMTFESKVVNSLAKNVFAAYLFEGIVRIVLSRFLDISAYYEKWYFGIMVLVYVLLVMSVCFSINILRQCLLGRMEDLILEKLDLSKNYLNKK